MGSYFVNMFKSLPFGKDDVMTQSATGVMTAVHDQVSHALWYDTILKL